MIRMLALTLCLVLSLPSHAGNNRFADRAPVTSFDWIDSQFVIMDRALLRIEAPPAEQAEGVAYHPVHDIYLAQIAGETLQGEFRWPGPITRLPLGLRDSHSARKAIQDLCLQLARSKDIVERTGNLDETQLRTLRWEIANAREILQLVFFARQAQLQQNQLR